MSISLISSSNMIFDNADLQLSWIQGHPEFGFGFKALVCHDGVFDSAYNGFSTDELFFVSVFCLETKCVHLNYSSSTMNLEAVLGMKKGEN